VLSNGTAGKHRKGEGVENVLQVYSRDKEYRRSTCRFTVMTKGTLKGTAVLLQ
jgi:hypothetical protein